MTAMSKTISPCGPAGTDCRCGECGGLECLCRPRFFAGQLLTEEDLNRLDYYIRARFRMHNLSLHGVGVVNGLKVICDPCGEVKVTVGHAISPCGDDIILCEDAAVAICDLIRKCRAAERKRNDCDPPRRIPAGACDDLEETWVLAIKYDERPTRGVTPLRPGAAACGCGSSCDCGDCECDECCEGSAAAPQAKPRTAPTTCEPTVICEGYRFCVYRLPEPEPEQDDDRGLAAFDPDSPLVQQLRCCFELLAAVLPTMPQLPGSDGGLTLAQRRALTDFCCRLRTGLLDYFRRHAHTSCEIVDILAALRCPDPANPDGFAAAWVQAVLQLFAIWLDAIRQCICLALLPPAPAPTCEDRIPLATVRVRVRDCGVLSVCNWTTERRMLVSWPSVVYWLGSLGVWGFLRDLLDRICCNSLVDLFDDVGDDQPGVAAAPADRGFAAAAATTPDAPGFAALSVRLDAAWAGIAPSLGMTTPRLGLAEFAAEARRTRDDPPGLSRILNSATPRLRFPDAGRPLGEIEQANLPEFLAVEIVGKPVLARIFGAPAEPKPQGDAPMLDLAALNDRLDRQQAEIDALRRAVAGGKE